MKVQLLAKTQLTNKMKEIYENPVEETKIVAFTAIRTCYSHLNPSSIYLVEKDKFLPENTNSDDQGKRGADALIKHITSSGHTSTLEHINYTFTIEGVSRTLLAQLTRHRHFSYSVQSQRYVTLSSQAKAQGASFYMPDSVAKNEEAKAIYDRMTKAIQEAYDELKQLKIASEDARMVLPNATLCNLVLTGNLRSILEFYKKRNPNTHAQQEIQELAEAIKQAVIEEDAWTQSFFN